MDIYHIMYHFYPTITNEERNEKTAFRFNIYIRYTEWLFGYLVPNLIHSFVPVFHSPHRQLQNEGARRRKRETRGCQAGFLFV